MEIPKLKFTRLWTDPDAFPTVETDEAVVRADMQALHNETRDYMNRTLGPTLESVGTLLDDTISGLASQSAARKLGFSPTEGVPETTVQGAIENVQSQLAGAALGSIPDGSITAQQLAASAVTAGKVAPGAIAFLDVSGQYQISIGLATAGATSSEVLSHEFRFLPALGVVAFNLNLKIETQEKAAIQFVAEGPYTPRYNVNGEAVSASVTGSTSGSLGVGVCANITYTESSGKRYMETLLHVSNAADCVVVVSGWFFAHEAEET